MASPQPVAPPPRVPMPAAPPSAPVSDASWTVLVGILLGLSASVGINLGNNLQSLGLKRQKENKLERKPLVWKVGAFVFAVASLINFGAFGFAPAAVLAPLESIQFVTNLIFGSVVNNSIITNRMIAGSMLVVTGCIIAVIFGPNQVAKFSVDELTSFWADTWWILYLGFLSGFASAAQVVHIRFECAKARGRSYPYDSIILPVTFAVSSAVVGSMCVVMSKCMSELVEIFVTEGIDVLASPLFYVSLVLTVVFLCGWLYRLNQALGKYDPLFIIPLLQSNYILFSIVSGGVYFQEFAMLDLQMWVLFVLGIVIMFIGLYQLAPTAASAEANATALASAPAPAPAASERTSTTRLSLSRRVPTMPGNGESPPPGGMMARVANGSRQRSDAGMGQQEEPVKVCDESYDARRKRVATKCSTIDTCSGRANAPIDDERLTS